MMAIQIMVKSAFGLLLGICAGAILGGFLGVSALGSIGLLSGMVLGAMIGSAVGAGAGFLQAVRSRQGVVQRRPLPATVLVPRAQLSPRASQN